MSRADLQRDIRALYGAADGGLGLPALMDGVCAALARHPDALAGISGRYAVLAADSGYACAFALEDGVFFPSRPMRPWMCPFPDAKKTCSPSFAASLRPWRRSCAAGCVFAGIRPL